LTTVIEIIRDVEGVQRIRSDWTQFHAHPNSDIDFYLNVVQKRKASTRPHIIVLRKDGAVAAILVGRCEAAHLESKFGYKTLCRVPTRQLTFIYQGQLGDFSEANSQLFFQEIMRSLRAGEADLAELHFIRTDSPLYLYASKRAPILVRDYAPCSQSHRSTVVATSAEQFYGGLSPKVRKNQKWQARKIAQDFNGQVEVKTFTSVGQIEQMFADVEPVAARTYQRGLGTGFMATPEMRDRFEFEARKGWLRAFVLSLAGAPAAFWIGSLYRGTLHSNFMGYDPAYAKNSPGMYLIMKCIEEFCAKADQKELSSIDWGLGDAQYKEVLGTEQWSEAAILIFSPSSKGVALNALRTPLSVAERFIKAGLSNSDMLQRVKTKWRKRLRTVEPLAPKKNGAALAAVSKGVAD
jgi:hypothetical protein